MLSTSLLTCYFVSNSTYPFSVYPLSEPTLGQKPIIQNAVPSAPDFVFGVCDGIPGEGGCGAKQNTGMKGLFIQMAGTCSALTS